MTLTALRPRPAAPIRDTPLSINYKAYPDCGTVVFEVAETYPLGRCSTHFCQRRDCETCGPWWLERARDRFVAELREVRAGGYDTFTAIVSEAEWARTQDRISRSGHYVVQVSCPDGRRMITSRPDEGDPFDGDAEYAVDWMFAEVVVAERRRARSNLGTWRKAQLQWQKPEPEPGVEPDASEAPTVTPTPDRWVTVGRSRTITLDDARRLLFWRHGCRTREVGHGYVEYLLPDGIITPEMVAGLGIESEPEEWDWWERWAET